MKENTIIYVGLGIAALYLLSQRKTTVPVSTYPGAYPGVTPVSQPSQSVVLPLIATGASLLQQLLGRNTPSAATNVANGYNADGTINLPDQSQSSIDDLTFQPLQTINIPSNNGNLLADTQTNSPSGTDDFSTLMSEYYG